MRNKELRRILSRSSPKDALHRTHVEKDLASWPEAERKRVEKASRTVIKFIRYHNIRISLKAANTAFEESKKPNRELAKTRQAVRSLENPSQKEVQEAMAKFFANLEEIRGQNSEKYNNAKEARQKALRQLKDYASNR